ncbi:hypothetical protein ABZV60_34385 [Streptomyces sp. NPDC004787]|uniref:hypothetical protein n=1 Tax=Streptomyces sp. NPDC004787 TaxID=3154291 RepID=UPI0033A17770
MPLSNRSKRQVGALAFSLAITLAAMGTGPGASAASSTEPIPGGYSTWGEFFTVQNQLDELADKAQKADLTAGGKGFGSAIVSAQNRELALYWKGRIPQSIENILQRAPSSIKVKRLTARHSMLEMQQAADYMAHQRGSNRARIVRAYPNADASGITVGVSGSVQEIQGLEAVRKSSVPVRFSSEPELTPTADRHNDTAPYKGGAAWFSAGQCSTGFGVKIAGRPQMLSAAHCAEKGWNVRFGSLDNPVAGKVVDEDLSLDVSVLDVPSTSRIYRKMINSPWTSEVRVGMGTHVGDVVCTGGSRSGENCNIHVWAVEVSQGDIRHLAAGKQWNNKTAVAYGDSGGPVFVPCANTGCSGVAAKGIISQGGGPVQCGPGLPTGTVCTSIVGFQPISYALSSFSATLLTS